MGWSAPHDGHRVVEVAAKAGTRWCRDALGGTRGGAAVRAALERSLEKAVQRRRT